GMTLMRPADQMPDLILEDVALGHGSRGFDVWLDIHGREPLVAAKRAGKLTVSPSAGQAVPSGQGLEDFRGCFLPPGNQPQSAPVDRQRRAGAVVRMRQDNAIIVQR